MIIRLFVFLLILIQFSFSFGGGLGAPISLGTTAVLPKGVRSIRIGGVVTTVDNWHNDSGLVTGIAEPFNQRLSYSRLLKAESNENLKLNVESQLKNKGVDLNSIAGNSYADVNTRVVATIPAIAYGLTDKWMLAVAVPIVYTKMDIATGFVGSDQLQQLVSDFSQKSKKQTQLIQQKLNDVISTELNNKGYQPLENQEKTQVGDLILMAKYLAHQDVYYSWALTNTFVLPTAQVRDVNKVIDPTPGDGQFDYGIESAVEVPISSQLKFINQTGYVIQFKDTRVSRIPMSEDERLSKDIERISRDLGDQVYTTLGTYYSPSDFFTLGGSYTLAYKQRDQWSGSTFSADRYRALGVQTEQYMQALYLQAGASTVQSYKRKDFPVPLMATLGMGKVVAGRNVRSDPVWSLNMTMFF
jgi:hypothetical protein